MSYKHVDIKQYTYKLKRIVYRLKERRIAELIQVLYHKLAQRNNIIR